MVDFAHVFRLRLSTVGIAAAQLLIALSFPTAVIAQSDPDGVRGKMQTIPINAPIPRITIDAGIEQINGAGSTMDKSGDFTASGGVTVVGGTEFTLHADSVSGNLKTGVSTAIGHVSLRELNSTLSADSIFVSQKGDEGAAQNLVLRQPPYTIVAQKILFLPNETDAYSAVLTTCPPDQNPDFSIRARLIVFLQSADEIVIHDGAVYLQKSRLFVDKRFVLHLHSKSGVVTTGSKLVSNTFNYNDYSGASIDFTTHFGLTQDNSYATIILPQRHGLGAILSGTTQLLSAKSHPKPPAPKSLIGLLRSSAEATQPILPYGDPLLMHWFQGSTPMNDRFTNIPNTLTISGSSTVSVRERVYGRETNDLFYSRLPEVSLSAVVPISGPRELPTSRDPAQMRTTLRQIALYAVITPQLGRYSEIPDNVTGNRESLRLDLESRPILISRNLLFKPRMTVQDSDYPGTGDSFRVFQYDLALEKYLTDRTGYGFEYQRSQESGDSIFEFDTPYTTSELDGRFQIAFRKLIVGGLVRYDLVHGNPFSEELLIAPIRKSVIPRFTYDFRNSSFGFGVDIEGITF